MKAQSALRNMFLSLTIISLVAAAALAIVSKLTHSAISEAKALKNEAAVVEVLPKSLGYVTLSPAEQDGVVLAYDGQGACVGAAVEASSENGFGGHLAIMVGIDANGVLVGYKILESSETPGLGEKAAEWFQKEGKGCVIGMKLSDGDLQVSKDGGQVDAISGSTITSRAFCEVVNSAYQKFLDAVR
ncbi:MAG: RnfABCDGE type electron transport complex subunit G [Bacteroidales bacterium]|nr:RnfABCDGE type electron transport complex subunit G [Candidatus Colimorpha onthohippi]